MRLPAACRELLRSVGAVRFGSTTALGPTGPLSIDAALRWQSFIDPAFPTWLVPLAVVGRDRIVCLDARTDEERLVLLDSRRVPDGYQALREVATYDLEVVGRLRAAANEESATLRLDERVREFSRRTSYDHAEGGTLPRPHLWRPFRYCIQDVVLGTVVLRLQRGKNRIEVDVFVAAEVPQLDPDAGAEALILFVLAEAWRCGSSMEIEFTRHVEGGRVPAALLRLAARSSVPITGRRVVTSTEARALWLELTGLCEPSRARVDEWAVGERLLPERVCFAIHSGAWSRAEVDHILATSSSPGSVLGGTSVPLHGHPWLQDVAHGAGAALLGRLVAKLTHRSAPAPFDLEDDGLRIQTIPAGSDGVVRVSCDEPLPLPWMSQQVVVPVGEELVVVVRARAVDGFVRLLATDREVLDQARVSGTAVLLVPGDFREVPEAVLVAAGCSIASVLVAPESYSDLCEASAARLNRARTSRRA